MGNFLDTPKIDKDSESYITSSGLCVGSSGMQGWRPEMEDSHVTKDMPSQPDHTFFAVFDGHGGAGAAAYAALHMIENIEKTSHWSQYIKDGASDSNLLKEAFTQAFLNIDVTLRTFQGENSRDTSGCTSVTAMITPKFIICANAGDSRCVMGTNNTAKAMSEDHKPNDELEQRRIEAAGGRVQWKRVDGDLAVSRGLGDFHYKNRSDLTQGEQKVSCEPEFVVHERCPEDEVLLLACDGLWDVMSNEEAISKIREIFATGNNDMTLVAEEMLNFALDKGSKDNISAVVVRLPGAKIPAGRVPPAANFRQRMDSKADDEGMGEIGVPPDRNI